METYNVYTEEGKIIGNGGMTAEQAAGVLGISLDEFRGLKKNRKGVVCCNGMTVRKEKESVSHVYMTQKQRDEWDKVCRGIRGILCRT